MNACSETGHEWVDAGGGIEICAVCQDDREAPRERCHQCNGYGLVAVMGEPDDCPRCRGEGVEPDEKT